MADQTPLERLAINEDHEAILELVQRDIQQSYEFKRTHWPHDKLSNRRRAYRGDPGVFAWPYATLNAVQGPRPVNNWTFRQINHKVGKLTRTPTRITLAVEGATNDPEARIRLAALKKRLEMKGREARWKRARRIMAKDAAVTGLGVRAVGLDLSGPTPKIQTWPVMGEEYHRDPGAETLREALWTAWRRWVDEDTISGTLAKAGYDRAPGGSRMDLVLDGRDPDVAFPDDLILTREVDQVNGPYIPIRRILLTDYYRRDNTIDVYYSCPECGQEATVGRQMYKGQTYPVFHCQRCDTTLKANQVPSWDTMSKGMRYPYGRHIRILGKSEIVYAGPNKLPLQRCHPFIEMGWYDSDHFVGYAETELLNSPQVMNNVALAMIADNAIFNAHPKKVIVAGGLMKPDNNNPGDWIEVEEKAVGSVQQLPPGPVGEAAKILLERSIQDSYALPGNDPVAHGAQPDTIRSGVGIARVVAASEVSLYLLQDALFDADQDFYEIARDICREIDTPALINVPNEANGLTTEYPYDRTLMQPHVGVAVSADRELDQEREELFTRALQLYQIGDPWIDWDLLHQLSGLPEDLIAAAQNRVRARAGGLDPMMIQQLMGQQSGTSSVNGGRPAGKGGGNGAGGPPSPGMNRMKQSFEGARTVGQVRPPSRSRGAQTASSPTGGGGSFG